MADYKTANNERFLYHASFGFSVLQVSLDIREGYVPEKFEIFEYQNHQFRLKLLFPSFPLFPGVNFNNVF